MHQALVSPPVPCVNWIYMFIYFSRDVWAQFILLLACSSHDPWFFSSRSEISETDKKYSETSRNAEKRVPGRRWQVLEICDEGTERTHRSKRGLRKLVSRTERAPTQSQRVVEELLRLHLLAAQ